MRLRTVLITVLMVQLLLVGALLALAALMHINQIRVEEAEERRIHSYLLADELRQSSDDLTRFARSYVVTGEPRYEQYFLEILAIRNGDVPRPEGYEGVYWDLVVANQNASASMGPAASLRSRMLEAGFTNDEFDMLSESQNRSDALVRLEDVAMNAVKGRFDDGTGTFTREGAPDRDWAMELVHGQEYHQAKAAIMKPLGIFMGMIDHRTLTEINNLNVREAVLHWVDSAIAVLLLLTTIISVWIIAVRVLRPVEHLADAAHRVSQGDLTARAELTGGNEIAAFGRTFDMMVTSVQEKVSVIEEARANALEQASILEHERARSEKLLLNVLPAAIADRLKDGEDSIAESYPEVSVLFADIVGFTEMSERIGAKQVVDMLNEVFGILDELALSHGIEKIKTIGDCYMVVAGVPDRSPTHAQQIADFALDMKDAIDEYAQRSGRDFAMRTGVHTGTVVAGIVGTSKFAYDLWGDVVNIASRMESSSEPGHIQVSDAVKIRLQDDYVFQARGDVEIKGKGKMHTWYLTGRRKNA